MIKMKKAIVFAGGGSKGAYQIGAWKALNELGEQFDIATGTSIGSINAAFYVQHGFDEAYDLWCKLKAENIMANGINLEASFESVFSQREHLIPFVRNYINAKGADVTPFHEMLRQQFIPERFFGSDIDYALMTVAFPSLDPVLIRKADMTDRENGWKWIAASCACFPVFPVMEIEDKNYIDGGYYDNIPVAAAFSLGAERVVVIDLKPENNHEGYIKHPWVTYIKPSRDLGTFLNFDRDILDRSIRLGYNDTMKVFGRYYGNLYTFIPGDDRSRYEAAAEEFIRLLTETEASFDFSGSVKFQRINKQPGCTTILAQRCRDGAAAGPTDLFFAALEIYLKLIGKDDEDDIVLDDLLYDLKNEADLLYPMLDYGTEKAFSVLEEFFMNKTPGKNQEYKKIDSDDRMKIIAMAVARTLQRIRA